MCVNISSVMSQTFTLKGRTSSLSIDIAPPIDLDARYSYTLNLISFSTWNSIPNIEPGKNKLYYTDQGKKNVVEIPTGSYEIVDIEAYLQNQLSKTSKQVISLKPNNNTLKCELKSIYDIDFRPEDSIGKLLGFSPRLLKANILHTSDLPVEIISVKSIRLECNIISGSYYTSNPSHTLYEFTPTVDPGYSIIIEPINLIHLSVNTNRIDNITIDILDQDSRPVNFRGEEIIVRLELKKHVPGF